MLKNQRIVVIGGSSGIGLATAKSAAADGANVVIASSNRQRIDKALSELPENTRGIVADAGKAESLEALFKTIGKFDHLVYTAGDSINLFPIKDTGLNAAKQFFDVRYWGAFAAVKFGATYINQGGSINLIGGTASRRPGAGWSLAASACSALEGFARAMAVELAPIRVNLVAPVVVKTDLWDAMSETGRNNFYTYVSDTVLLMRAAEAEDIAGAFLYLMQEPHATGQILVIDGGSVLV
jgi:NAD(P)-dependent dehydrogenase (short-subunit alcohol dehydrogenase family)